ncbi:family 78 glycoside hydrolase catalytic domain [Streptomyces sp. ISL-90]|nr:family 78 glycoside hydrolase catalytic domain [Streptomyces sp. ISL-90]
MSLATPTIEHHRNPLGIGERRPRISWVVSTAPAGWQQTRAEIELRSDGRTHTHEAVGSESVLVRWPFPALRSQQQGTVRVRVWGDETDAPSAWSPFVSLEAGLLDASDWLAHPIGPSWTEDPDAMRRPALLRTTFTLDGEVRSARLYITAHGLYRAEINGLRVGDDELAPGWTSYPSRLRHYTYDVTHHLHRGPNAIGAWLGDGWYRGRLGFHGGHVDLYGTQTALLAQLHVDYADGTHATIRTGAEWTCAPAPIITSGLLEGEHYDAREEHTGWSTATFDPRGWEPVSARTMDTSVIVAPDGPPVRCTDEVAPINVTSHPGGRLIIDFGQNVVGRVRLTTTGEAGHEIQIRHAEVLDSNGNLSTRPLRGAHSVDRYICRGEGTETWEPMFTIHGFRYVEITGMSGQRVSENVVARVLHTDMRRTGWFECSDPDLNRLHENVVWSMRGNFVDLPTDCPQRDERLGWTGDIQVFTPTAGYLYDCAGLLSSWLKDVTAEQLPDGTVPWFVPGIPGGEQWTPPRPGAGWGDAAALVPWALHREFDDRALLERQYPTAKAWADLEHRLAGPDHVWDSSYQLGDWLDPSAPPDDPANGLTDPNLVATAYYAHTSATLAKMTRETYTHDHADLSARAALARDGFRDRYRTAPGTLTSDSQAAYALAIVFGLFESDELETAGSNLARLVRQSDIHLTTGFLGTPVLLDALTITGHGKLAQALINQRTVPSWLYPVTMGATTIWERWDSMLPNGEVNPGDMTSFNHFAFGAVADWMHRTIAGLESLEPGWKRIRYRPGLESGLSHAAAVHDTPYGRAGIAWRRAGSTVDIDVVIPHGSVGALELPGESPQLLTAGHHRITHALSSAAA